MVAISVYSIMSRGTCGMGRSWGVSAAADIIEQVFNTVSHWREAYLACGVAKKDIEQFKEVDDYLNR